MAEEKPFITVCRYIGWDEIDRVVAGYLEKGYCILGEPKIIHEYDKNDRCYFQCFFIKETFILQVKKAILNGKEV